MTLPTPGQTTLTIHHNPVDDTFLLELIEHDEHEPYPVKRHLEVGPLDQHRAFSTVGYFMLQQSLPRGLRTKNLLQEGT